MQIIRTSKNMRGTVQCDNTTMHLLQANDFVADAIRQEVKKRNILLINIVSSAGSGKTTLLQETAKRLKDKLNIKVLVGDLETERDADRIRGGYMPLGGADDLAGNAKAKLGRY